MRGMRKLTGMVALAAIVGMVAAACGSKSDRGSLGGPAGRRAHRRGATFPSRSTPCGSRTSRRSRSGAKINYQAIGSGGGVQQFTAQTVDFGASDAPLKDEEIAALPATGLEIPTVIGGVVIAYNVSGSTPA